MIAPGDAWGPFADNLEPGERLARLRALRAIVRLLCGPRGGRAEAALLAAETRSVADPVALVEVLALEPIDRRRVLASYAGLSRVPAGAVMESGYPSPATSVSRPPSRSRPAP